MPTLDRLPGWVDALWLGCLALYITAGAAIIPFHGDESTLMIMGRDFHYIFVEGDLAKVLYDESWAVNPHEQHLRLLNGTVSKMVYGGLQWLNGFGPRDLNRNWNWGRDYDSNVARGAIPDGELLRQARLASAIQLALAAAAFFQFVKMTVNRPNAFLASALFALHPNMLINGRRAMMEGSHILGLMLVLLAAAWLLQEQRWRTYALLGISAGFAIAAKHPNVIVCALVFLACARRPVWQLAQKRGRDFQRSARDLIGIALAGIITVIVFLLLNPAWWRNPMEVAPLIVELRQGLLQDQVDIFGGYNSFTDQVAGFFQFAFVGARQYFEVSRWEDYDVITAQIGAYEGSWLSGLLFIGSSGRLGLISLLLALYGALKLARDQAISREARWLVFIWIIGSALAALWLTPLPWARYYLPLLPAVILLVSYALTILARSLIREPDAGVDGLALLD
ncbi:MAG: glycosyltransferase family 39 protein [Chloroflexi bacterium]|nr:glycosyltransferase family 39 protein [Chloroflexota bacterium]